MADSSGDENRWSKKYYGLGFETHDSEFCEELFRSLDADILSSHDSLSLLERQYWVKLVMLGIFATVCGALRFTLFWTLTVVERRWLNSSRVRRLFKRVSETNGGAEGSYMIRWLYFLAQSVDQLFTLKMVVTGQGTMPNIRATNEWHSLVATLRGLRPQTCGAQFRLIIPYQTV